ncbi:hypothetical protein Q0N71_29030 [Bacillus thuringiensis]|uniref:hypothetical protein n=1 Tax=Bacillus thuringiensis TaxID=1428 RepID=UPI003458DE76
MLHKKKIACASLLSLGILAGGSFVGNSSALAAPTDKGDFQSIVNIKKETEQNRIKNLKEFKNTIEEYGNKYGELSKTAQLFFLNSDGLKGSPLANILDSENNIDFLNNIEKNIAKLEKRGKIDKFNLTRLMSIKTELDIIEYKILIYVKIQNLTFANNKDFRDLIKEVNSERNKLNKVVKDSILTKNNAHEFLLLNQLEYFVKKFN